MDPACGECDRGDFALSPTGKTTRDGPYTGSGQDVVVPRGATCDLLPGTTLSGDVTVRDGATFDAEGVTVGGDLSARGSASITICGSSIAGDALIAGSVGPVLIGDTGAGCSAGVTFGHDLTVQRNLPGGATVERNHAGHDALCHNNTPQSGSGNTAAHTLACPA